MRKGFTLIELLATIVVLAAISVITIPLVFNAISNTREQAYVASVLNIAKLSEDYFSKIVIDDEEFNHDENIYSELEFKGERPISANVKINTDGKSAVGLVYMNKCFRKDYNTLEVVILDDIASCNIGIDVTAPTVVFGTNGNASWAQNRSTTVTVTDSESNIDNANLKYQWTMSTTEPTEVSFVETFTNGDTINSPTGVTGTYYLWILAKDASTNTAIVRTNLFNLDNTAPEMTMLGDNPFNMFPGVFTDPGVSATDNIDGDITNLVSVVSTVTPLVTGTYSVTYTSTDSSGNFSSLVRTVIVSDSTPPTVAFGTNGHTTWAQSRSTTVTVSDSESGVNASSLEYQWTTSTVAPTEVSFVTSFTSGATITSPAGVSGTYYLWILAKDLATNTAIVRTNVFNLDNTNPVLTISGANPYEITVGGAFTEPGRSATDNSGVTPTITNTTIPTTSGTYTITYTATDQAGNTATGTRSFYIWTAWSAWSTTAVSPTATRQVETQLQISTRTSYSCGCSTCYSCGGGCPGTNWRDGYTNPLSYDGRLSGTSCNCEYQHPNYYYTSGSYPANSYSCGCSTCYSAWSAWSNTASCTANTLTQCQTLYRSRTR
jgi:prepilin-type N-terminal cleavage/methylation domain-containing protein